MIQETVVADTGYTIDINGTPSSRGTKDPANVDTEVDDTDRTVEFWNKASFSDDRPNIFGRTIKISAIAIGDDVGSSKELVSFTDTYDTPYQTFFQPKCEATIKDLSKESYSAHVITKFEVLDGSTTEYSSTPGADTTINEV